MVDQAKLKKRAAEFEQKKQFDKALAVYAELLGPTERIDDLDIALFNKVGDLYLRQGQVSEALRSYERGADLYAERGFFTNAIALCNKILRQGVPRPDVLLRLGKIKIRTGFRSDAQQHFEEYVGHMRLSGAADVAFANLRSFADSEPDNEDLQVVVADLMARGKQTADAVALLDAFRARAQERGQTALVQSVVQRIRAIDPEYAPPTDPDERRDEQGDVVDGTRGAASPASGMSGLVFFEPEGHERTDTRPRVSRPTPIAPPSVRPSTPTPIYTTSIPGFSITPADGLVLDFMPQEPESEPANPDDAQSASPLAVPDEPLAAEPLAAEPLALEPLVTEPPVVEPDVGNAIVDAVPTQESIAPELAGQGLPLDPVMAGSETFEPITLEPLVFEPMNLAPSAPLESEPIGLVPVIEDAATEEESGAAVVAPPTDSMADSVAFAAPAADERAGDERAGDGDSPAVHAVGGTPAADEDAAFFVPEAVSLEDSVAADGTPASAAADAETAVAWIQPGSTDSLDFSAEFSSGLPELADDRAGSGFGDTSFAPGDPFEPQDIEAAFAPDALVSVPPAADAEPAEPAPERAVAAVAADAADAGMGQAPFSPIEVEAAQAPVAAVVEPSVAGEPTVAEAAMGDELPDVAPDVVPDVASDLASDVSAATRALTLADAQAYAGVGDRESAIRVLRDLLPLHEGNARYTDAADVLDELARLDADSLAVHHKRVELACRLDDRGRLVNAYLGLAGALRRGGNDKRARAVYQRVLDLEPELEDARSALGGEASPPAAMAQDIVHESDAATDADAGAERGAPEADVLAAADAAEPTPEHQPHLGVPPRPVLRPLGGPAPERASGAAASPRRTEPVRSVPAPPLADDAFVDLGDLLRDDEAPRSTRMVIEERAPTGDEQADFQEMLRKFKQGVSESVDEEDHESHYDLGVAYKEMGLVDEAIAAFQKALHGTDRRARTYEALGQCFVETRKFSVAAAVLRNALQEPGLDDRQLIGVLYLLGQAAEAVENQEEATMYYQRVFAVDVEFRDVTTRLDSLAQGVHPVSS